MTGNAIWVLADPRAGTAAQALGITPGQAVALERVAAATVPEPSSFALLLGPALAGLGGLLASRRRASGAGPA